MDLKRLTEVFVPTDIEWRVQRSGKGSKGVWAMVLAYVTNRAIQQRLDDVCGPENWKNEFVKAPDGGVLCGISIKTSSGEWVTKWDGAENTDIEAVKGGLSGSMKRAAVQWGIGRYLYNLDATFATITDDGKNSGKLKDGTFFKWNPPTLPDWALPQIPFDKEKFDSLCNAVTDYINAGVLTGEAAKRAETHIGNKHISGLEKVIEYCKKQEKK